MENWCEKGPKNLPFFLSTPKRCKKAVSETGRFSDFSRAGFDPQISHGAEARGKPPCVIFPPIPLSSHNLSLGVHPLHFPFSAMLPDTGAVRFQGRFFRPMFLSTVSRAPISGSGGTLLHTYARYKFPFLFCRDLYTRKTPTSVVLRRFSQAVCRTPPPPSVDLQKKTWRGAPNQ